MKLAIKLPLASLTSLRGIPDDLGEGVPGSIYINGILYNLRTRQDGTPLMRSTGEYLYRKA